MQCKCLSIAGFDGSGGAGIQADLKTFTVLGCYGMTVLTSVPVQNTCGVRSCYDISINCIREQLETIFDDIIPDTIKIGMLFSEEIIETVSVFLKEKAQGIPIILDPVIFAKSGDPLLLPGAMDSLKKLIIPIADIITPNLPEAYALVDSKKEPKILIYKLIKLGCKSVLLKGGHGGGVTADDIYLDHRGLIKVFSSDRIDSKNTHGTGCTLSSAIAAFIARGTTMEEACKLAKFYINGAIKSSKDKKIGKGAGPVDHSYFVNFDFIEKLAKQ